jgi:hypothetical protein
VKRRGSLTASLVSWLLCAAHRVIMERPIFALAWAHHFCAIVVRKIPCSRPRVASDSGRKAGPGRQCAGRSRDSYTPGDLCSRGYSGGRPLSSSEKTSLLNLEFLRAFVVPSRNVLILLKGACFRSGIWTLI